MKTTVNFIVNIEKSYKHNMLKKKIRRMRIFKHRIFLSLLAGKFTTIEQMLLTE